MSDTNEPTAKAVAAWVVWHCAWYHWVGESVTQRGGIKAFIYKVHIRWHTQIHDLLDDCYNGIHLQSLWRALAVQLPFMPVGDVFCCDKI